MRVEELEYKTEDLLCHMFDGHFFIVIMLKK